jgi:hypothetical protein
VSTLACRLALLLAILSGDVTRARAQSCRALGGVPGPNEFTAEVNGTFGQGTAINQASPLDFLHTDFAATSMGERGAAFVSSFMRDDGGTVTKAMSIEPHRPLVVEASTVANLGGGSFATMLESDEPGRRSTGSRGASAARTPNAVSSSRPRRGTSPKVRPATDSICSISARQSVQYDRRDDLAPVGVVIQRHPRV